MRMESHLVLMMYCLAGTFSMPHQVEACTYPIHILPARSHVRSLFRRRRQVGPKTPKPQPPKHQTHQNHQKQHQKQAPKQMPVAMTKLIRCRPVQCIAKEVYLVLVMTPCMSGAACIIEDCRWGCKHQKAPQMLCLQCCVFAEHLTICVDRMFQIGERLVLVQLLGWQ